MSIDFLPIESQGEQELIDFQPVDFRPAPERADREEPKGLLSRIGSNLGDAFTEVTTPIESEGGMTDFLPKAAEKVLKTAGHIGKAAGDIFMEGIKGAYKYGVNPVTQQSLENVGGYLINTDVGKAQVETLKGLRGAYRTLAKEYPRLAEDVEAGANALNLIPAYQIGKTSLKLTKNMGAKAFEAAKELTYPSPPPEEALKQVLQGPQKNPVAAARDIEKGRKALEVINTSGVDSYGELSRRLEAAKPIYSEMVDAELMKDATKRSMGELETVKKTKGGAEIRSNYVSDALDNLDEFYTKTNDPLKAAEIQELRGKAEAEGLTRKDINDIARLYNVEFGGQAFNRSTGEALTSVNAQAYENTRTGLKGIAREGLSEDAKELDSILSSIYNTQRLIDKNYAAAERLKAKVDARGVGENIGRAALMALDIATMGTVKGAVLKLLPRGLGYKVKNYIDLENALKRNLKIIDDEIKRVEKKSQTREVVRYLRPPGIPPGERPPF